MEQEPLYMKKMTSCVGVAVLKPVGGSLCKFGALSFSGWECFLLQSCLQLGKSGILLRVNMAVDTATWEAELGG